MTIKMMNFAAFFNALKKSNIGSAPFGPFLCRTMSKKTIFRACASAGCARRCRTEYGHFRQPADMQKKTTEKPPEADNIRRAGDYSEFGAAGYKPLRAAVMHFGRADAR